MALTRDDLITRLLRLPTLIQKQEEGLLQMQKEAQEAKDALKEKEYTLLLAEVDGRPVIDGKNESIRGFQLQELTGDLRRDVRNAEALVAGQRICVTAMQNEFAALRAVARLFAGGEPL